MTNKLTKKDINKVYVRNLFGYQWGWNYEKMQGLGYAWVMMPALKRLYSEDPVAMKKALKTHLGFMNTTPAMSHLIVGADMALEEDTAAQWNKGYMHKSSALSSLKNKLPSNGRTSTMQMKPSSRYNE